jgi:polysaccharide pyruvyl transferase WcaK-like protein
MIISIFASIWAQNLWDELILKNEINLLEKKYEGNIKFYVFTYDKNDVFFKKDNVEYVDYFPIWIKNPKNIFKNIIAYFKYKSIVKKSDLIVIWWGWIIYDEEHQSTFNPLNQWAFRCAYFKKLYKKVLFFSIWINIKNEKNIPKVKKIFDWYNEIVVRDSFSLSYLESLWIKAYKSMDPVFCDAIKLENLTWNSHFIKSIMQSYLVKTIDSKWFEISTLDDIDFENKTVWIWFRTWYMENEEKNIEAIIEKIINAKWKIILVPHSFHKTDEKANDYIFLNKFAIKYNLEICKTMQESYEIYTKQKINFCLAMRLHSIILSQVYKIPFIWFSYSKKTSEILKQIEKK